MSIVDDFARVLTPDNKHDSCLCEFCQIHRARRMGQIVARRLKEAMRSDTTRERKLWALLAELEGQ